MFFSFIPDSVPRLRGLTLDLAVGSRRHRLATRRAIHPRECANETWLKNEALPTAYPRLIRQYCKLAGFSPIFD